MKVNEWFKKRVCFHPEFGQEAYPFKLPVFNPELKKLDPTETYETIFNQEDFLSWLYETNDYYKPEMPSFEFIRALVHAKNPEICFTAFVDDILGQFIELESACKEYRVLPYGGSLLEQPNIILDAFSVIRGEKIKYENFRNKKMFDNLKSDKPSTTKRRSSGR